MGSHGAGTMSARLLFLFSTMIALGYIAGQAYSAWKGYI